MPFRPLLIAVAVVATSVFAPFAYAAAPATGEVVVGARRVSLARADLATPAGADRVYARLAAAARAVCRSSIAPQTYSSECANRALDAAVADVADERLAAVHRERRRG